ncbi:DUF3408 domain-containing protein [Chryseobacterium lathyri]|uniref:Conjugal transfer protein TraB n=1 Tax=Chryseobacterium lathyri TaxID=395933 RepID=A0A511Y7K8_9FLAO|nr:DUF3408 domain-containing protein [Chryseobacterium lathyri]GEN71179.1 hypothetical protein CLA01_12510 [Chryseobacterium lathyri]
MEEQKPDQKKKPALPEISNTEMLDLILEPAEPSPVAAIVPEVESDIQNEENTSSGASGNNGMSTVLKGKSKRTVQNNYETLFLQGRNISGSKGKVVYIHPDFHRRITRILQIVGEDKISLFTYLHHILEHHFSLFEKEIIADFNRKNNEPIL